MTKKKLMMNMSITNLKKEIMLKLLKDNLLGITQLLLEKAMVMKLK